jgi:hypothetical protein
MDGEWVETTTRKMIHGIVTQSRTSNFSEKGKCQTIFQKWYGAYDARVRVCFVITTKPKNILHVALSSDLFEGRGNIANTKIRSHH